MGGLSLLLGLPLLGSALLLVIPSQNKNTFYIITLACLAFTLAFGIFLLTPAIQDPTLLSAPMPFLAERIDWFSLPISENSRLRVQYFVGLDGLNTALLLLALLILWLGAIASNEIKKHYKAYFALYLLLSAAVIGTFIALDFFLFYLCFEFMLLPMYFLVGIWGGLKREYAAIKFFMYTLLGSVLILIVGIALALGTDINGVHTFDLLAFADLNNFSNEALIHPDGGWYRSFFFTLLVMGFCIKLPTVPLHTWLPDAHVQAPTPISMVLAGVLLKIGGYGLMRMGLSVFPDVFEVASATLAFFGILSIVYGGIVALGQTNFKRLIAYSSIVHMGFVLLGLASLNEIGIQGAMFQMVSHGIISPLLFFLVGILYRRSHNLSIEHHAGLYQPMPRYAGLVAIAFFASLGLPTFSGFVGELMVLLGAFQAEQFPGYWVGFALLGIVLAASYYLWNYKRLFLGKFWLHPSLSDVKLTDVTPREWFVSLILILFTLLLGLLPSLLTRIQLF